MEFIEKFNIATNGEFKYLTPAQVVINKGARNVIIEMLIPYEMTVDGFSEDQKKTVYNAIRAMIPMSLELKVTYKKFYLDSKFVKSKCIEFMTKTYPSIPLEAVEFNIVARQGEAIVIIVQMISLFKSSIDEESFVKALNEFLLTKFTGDIKTELYAIDKEYDLDVSEESVREEYYTKRRICTTDHKKVFGKAIMSEPKYIADHGENEEFAVYCGKIEDFKINQSKKTGNPYFVFTINDTTGRLVCKAFSKTPVSDYAKLTTGDTVIVSGKLVIDTYAHDSVLLVNAAHRCYIDYDTIVNRVEFKPTPRRYETVTPYAYQDYKQVDLFTQSITPDSLQGREFVIFDLETTGFSPIDDKVIEVAAVKLVDGVIKECFSSYVNPQSAIPAKITALTTITDKDVADAPTIEDVFPDFYKFIGDAALVAHNSSFDMGFVYRIAEAQKYSVDNKSYDTLALAKATISSKNYKLETLCKTMGIVNQGAHRAINDALATTELFILIAEIAQHKNLSLI